MSISIVENIDCMVGMANIPDNHFSLAIVDPPYGLGNRIFEGGISKQIGRISASKYKGKEWDKKPKQNYFQELFRISRNQIIWGGNYFELPPCRGFLIWDKRQPLPSFSFGEFAWTSFDCVAKKFDFMYTNYVGGDAHKIHPTQKPVALYKWLLTNYAKQGDTIFDSHLGSQSSRIAAYDLGFDFTGFESDPDYFKDGNERFQRHIAQPNLFEPEKQEPTQEVLFS